MLASDGISSAKAALGQALQGNPSPRISKSDEDFEKMGVEFVWGYSDLNLDDLNDLFSRVRPSMICHPLLAFTLLALPLMNTRQMSSVVLHLSSVLLCKPWGEKI